MIIEMTTEMFHSVFQWVAIAAAVFAAIATVGTWYTGRLIDRDQKAEIIGLQQNVQTLQIQTRETAFRASGERIEEQGDGKYNFIFTLTPNDNKVIPILLVGARPTVGTIEKISISGPSLPAMSETLSKSDDPVWRGIRYTNVTPQALTVKILCTSDPQENPLNIIVDPLVK